VSFGQKSNDADALKLCVALQSTNFTTDAEAEDAVNKILSVIGASQKPTLQACSNINNAVAAVYKGQRYILYDRDFMNSLTAGSNKYWSNMFILAHEVGHHINGHSLDIVLYASDIIDPKSLEEKRKQELEADEFAGFVLAKLGASLSQTSKVLSNLPRISNENSSTHPSKDKRIASVRLGFKKGEVAKKNVSKPIVKLKKETEPTNYNNKVNLKIPGNLDWKKGDKIYIPSSQHYGWNKQISYHLHNVLVDRKPTDPFEIERWKKIQPRLKFLSITMGKTLGNIESENNENKYELLYKDIPTNKGNRIEGYTGPFYSLTPQMNEVNKELKELIAQITLFEFMNKTYSNERAKWTCDGSKGFRIKDSKFCQEIEKANIKYTDLSLFIGHMKGFPKKEMDLDYPTYLLFDYIVDNDLKGQLVTSWNGFSMDFYEDDYGLAGVNLAKYMHSNIVYFKNTLEFLERIKKGSKLYIRLNKAFKWNGYVGSSRLFDTSIKDDIDIKKYTFEFDLTGSSKALSF
jgi:hypothetical protein